MFLDWFKYKIRFERKFIECPPPDKLFIVRLFHIPTLIFILFIFSGDHKGSVWRGPQSPVWRRLPDHLWQDHPPGRLTLLLWRDEWNTSVLCLRRCLCKKMYYSSKKCVTSCILLIFLVCCGYDDAGSRGWYCCGYKKKMHGLKMSF